jgi:hypothetical protein
MNDPVERGDEVERLLRNGRGFQRLEAFGVAPDRLSAKW